MPATTPAMSDRNLTPIHEGLPVAAEGTAGVAESGQMLIYSDWSHVARGNVAILVEMIHDVRILPTGGRLHLPPSIRQWMGDPLGHWEGDTLVVETTNFTDKTSDVGAGMQRSTFRGSDDRLRLIERFTRVDPNTILYEFTVDDPTAFTKPWTAQIPMHDQESRPAV
jgi:hypothetical protein